MMSPFAGKAGLGSSIWHQCQVSATDYLHRIGLHIRVCFVKRNGSEDVTKGVKLAVGQVSGSRNLKGKKIINLDHADPYAGLIFYVYQIGQAIWDV